MGYHAFRTWAFLLCRFWILLPLSNSWIIMYNMVIYIALNRTPNMDCYWVGAVPNVDSLSPTPVDLPVGSDFGVPH